MYYNILYCRVNAAESSTSSLSNTQLAEHYANCIKLSSQNVSLYLSVCLCGKCKMIILTVFVFSVENQFKKCVWSASH